jgi:hypothetical protein
MRRVEVAFYFLPPHPGRRTKPYASSWKMTAEEAAARGAVGMVPGSLEVREIPETDEERTRATMFYQSAGRDSVKGPC